MILFDFFRIYGHDSRMLLVVIAAWVLSVMIAICAHEWAHAFAAYKNGDPTAKVSGRMTLNPKKHLEPVGFLMLLLVGIGWAKPVPVNPFNFRNFKKANFWVSIAGVLTNFIIAFVASFFIALLIFLVPNPGFWWWAAITFLSFLMMINLALMLFNLLPIPPLDGFNLLKSFTKPNNRYMQFARNNAMTLIMVVLVLSFIGFGIFQLVPHIQRAFFWLWGLIF